MRIAHRFRMEAGLPFPGAFRVVRTVRAAWRVLQIAQGIVWLHIARRLVRAAVRLVARESARSRLEVLRTAANLVVPGLVLQIAWEPAARTAHC